MIGFIVGYMAPAIPYLFQTKFGDMTLGEILLGGARTRLVVGVFCGVCGKLMFP